MKLLKITRLAGNLLILLCLVSMFACNQQEATKLDPELSLKDFEWIDLSYSFDSTTLYWPNNPDGFQHRIDAEGVTEIGYYYSSYTILTPEHGGTHLDAPIHFYEKGETVDQLALGKLTGEAVVIDVSEEALADRDYLIDSVAILNWEAEHGKIPEQAMVLFRTGYGQFYPDREAYFGTAKIGADAIPELHFPGIQPETATWLVKNRNVKAVGLDTPSLDYGQSKDFAAHQVLMENQIPGFENVANLDLLPAKGVYVIALPMKIKGGSGGPLRIIATVIE
ncbi:cyclase family protein [Algoriphagus sp. D3-2-R+10]|uniref:cyclase family protein n=1 Tax=Algoriphagus aurantiacus TaxID=3103948 RepID=UPI002B3C99E0|nr:cyclase family protein [Algoriphagus sp. D3-2-R+10]MEB2777917.1 cyclase family protein [Algoriphagus sp. D3-2-R+10]